MLQKQRLQYYNMVMSENFQLGNLVTFQIVCFHGSEAVNFLDIIQKFQAILHINKSKNIYLKSFPKISR